MSNMQKNRVNKNIRIANLEVLFLAGKVFFNRANNPNSKTRAKRIKEEEILTKKYKEKQCLVKNLG